MQFLRFILLCALLSCADDTARSAPPGQIGAYWAEEPSNWLFTINLNSSDPRKPLIVVADLKNVSGDERFLVAKADTVSYRFLWAGESPAPRFPLKPKDIQDEYGGHRLFQRVRAGATIPNEIDLASYFTFKPGVKYLLRIKRMLDEAGQLPEEKRASILSNEIAVQLSR